MCCEVFGLTRDELRSTLNPRDIYGPYSPGKTFRVLKKKDMKRWKGIDAKIKT